MEWTVTLRAESQYAEVVTGGAGGRDESLTMVKELTMVFRKERIRKVFIDHRKLISVSGNFTEVYHRPMEFNKLGVPIGIMVALVVRSEHKEFFKFLETVCMNRGFFFSIFEDKKAALEWLSFPS